MKNRTKIIVLAITMALTGAACSDNTSNTDAQTQVNSQKIVNTYAAKAQAAVPYPLEQMNTFLELEQQREKLLRFNNPAKIGYVYIFNPGVKEPIGYYTISGKISSTDSQMTTGDQVYWTCKHNHGCTPVVVESPSDDGSYGPNEQGYFFFTTEDVYVFVPQMMSPLYQDAPLSIYTVPQFNSPDDKPTSVGETIEQREENRANGIEAAKDAANNTPTEDSATND
jgi:hypothetical protein